jgi:RNA polymerase sigma factor (TIGR02999 family)
MTARTDPTPTGIFGAPKPRDADALLPPLYQELRAIAAAKLGMERPGHTLQPTALVNEAYLRLAQQRTPFTDKNQFLAAAAEVIRRVLVDHARAKHAVKRGGGRLRTELDEGAVPDRVVDGAVEVLDLDAALTKLASTNPRQARVVELRYFGGLEASAIAQIVGVSERTVDEDFKNARELLRSILGAR